MDYAQSFAKTMANRIAEARTTTSRGVVTALSVDGYVTFTDATGGTRKGVWVGDAPRVGDVITYLDEGRGIPLVFGATGKPQVPRYPLFYTGSVSNGTATSWATVIAQPSIMVAPAPLWMLVECYVEQGANGSANVVNYSIDPEVVGSSITFSGGILTAGVHTIHNGVNAGSAFTMLGRKQYAQGQTVGFHSRYQVSTSNIYTAHAAFVHFYPLD